jgi:deoxyguanosine kinase
MTQAPLIAFDGLIGAGKTTLADRLSRYTGYSLVLERFDENEFLGDFYAERPRWALAMQLWFLAERHKQLELVTTQRHTPIVSDYASIKNEVFASLLLKDREIRLYTALAEGLSRAIRHPDVLVYLDAENEVLLARIRSRERPYEKSIDASYLNDLRSAYEAYLAAQPGTNVVRVDTTSLDLTSGAQMTALFQRVLQRV